MSRSGSLTCHRQLVHELDGPVFDLGGVVVERGDVEATFEPDPLDGAAG